MKQSIIFSEIIFSSKYENRRDLLFDHRDDDEYEFWN